MAESADDGPAHPKLSLTADEKVLYGQLFRAADPDGFGAVSGDVAVSFFERTKLPADVLGEIWQIADTQNRGLLTPPGFSVVLRLIGHAQAGRVPSAELASQSGPLPRFEGFQQTTPSVPTQNTGQSSASSNQAGSGPVRVPPLSPEKLSEYSSLFEKSGADSGLLPGMVAKQIFERARLPNEVMGRIWNLADTRSRGTLDAAEFTIAMHLLASYKSGAMRGVPQTLPPGLYEAASRRPPARTSTGSSYPGVSASPVAALHPQYTSGSTGPPQSPMTRQQMGTPLSTQSTGDGWAITPADKAKFDPIFASLDKSNRGFITGDQAVGFFGNARLPDETLAQIWDLADINSEGRLNRDEFAIAMYLIRQQRGTKEGRGNLPATLPPALVPPMMRKQQAPPSQPTAPTFENAPVTKPKSAAEDLFGLDAISSTPTQVPQSTGGSAPGGPFQLPKSSPQPPTNSSLAPSTGFKPFIPSSSFGQSIASQQTGASFSNQSRGSKISASDDLLGDTDPEVSQKLTDETSELANLSNQVGNLARQTQDVQSTKASTAQELSQGSQQKKEFKARLSQLRILYEKEANDTKALQAQLSSQRNEVRRLQQDIAMLDGGLQDLRGQRQQLSATVEAELREKADLNERIRATNTEMSELKPRVEKLKAEARQQKGLVAISKKQFATLEADRGRLQDSLSTSKAELDEAQKKATEQSRSTPQTSSATSLADLASPAATNPFFRRGTGQSDGNFPTSSTSLEQSEERDKSFESMFGPSPSPPPAASPSPQASSEPRSSSQPRQILENETAAPPSPPLSFPREPSLGTEPPAPPRSRQVTSAALPFRTPTERSGSVSSSVRVAPPESRLSPADTPRADTPSLATSHMPSQDGELADKMVKATTSGEEPRSLPSSSASSSSTSPSPHVGKSTPTGTSEAHDATDEWKPSSASQSIPGAFPQLETPGLDVVPGAAAGGVLGGAAASTASKNGESQNRGIGPNNLGPNFDQYFGGPAHSRSPSEQAAEFDSAFAKLDQPGTNGTTGTGSEFPPIRILDEDDSGDSIEAPQGFDDDFVGSSSPLPTEPDPSAKKPNVMSAVPRSLQARPAFDSVPSTGSYLPEIEAQSSPPTYGDSVPNDNPNQFPPEFKGLLPHRGDPISSEPAHSLQHDTGKPASRQVSMPYAPEASKSPAATGLGTAPSTMIPEQRNNITQDDFDSAFADMTPAPVVDDDGEEDDFDTTFGNSQPTFDPTFDSPATTKSSVNAPPQSTSNFPPNTSKSASDAHPSNSEWDDMFADLDKSAPAASSSSPFDPPNGAVNTNQTFPPPPGPPPSSSNNNITGGAADCSSSPPPAAPQGTEHDDPLLKRLTAMGWSREDSLQALEKFDYNIDQAADHLTFTSST